MTHDEALKILHTYQKWRRGANIPMPEPKEIGEAIDVSIRVLRTIKRLEEFSTDDFGNGFTCRLCEFQAAEDRKSHHQMRGVKLKDVRRILEEFTNEM